MATSNIGQPSIELAGADQPAPEPTDEAETEGGSMTLIEHLEELRRRLFVCLIAIAVASTVAFIFWNPILGFLLTPLPSIANSLHPHGGQQLIVHGIGEAFTVALELAVVVGIAGASPVVLYQLWGFIAPGLTHRERRYAAPFTFLGVALFFVGAGVGFLVLRFPVQWLLLFGQGRFDPLIDAGSYFGFVAFFLLAFGVVFELPLVLTFLSLIGVVSSRLLRQKRKFAWFGLWIAATFITPGADPYSPIIIGVAMTALYELSIVLMRAIGK
ncbi:MAG TPA: twin-arginine translocase subunit TatC [Ktedonobacterales bacterium]|jgi:sec-independent protein translocase protein TatC|nr:twin-arginine translocase subunit TatC [Ktedonobacterales bacterium]